MTFRREARLLPPRIPARPTRRSDPVGCPKIGSGCWHKSLISRDFRAATPVAQAL